MSEYIRTNKFDTNECPNIFVKEKLIRTNVRIYIRDQYIRIFEYSNIFVTLCSGQLKIHFFLEKIQCSFGQINLGKIQFGYLAEQNGYPNSRDAYDELSDQGYTSLPKSDEIKSGQMVLK